MDSIKLLGNRIQKIRMSKKMTQEELAQSTGISTHYISDIERGLKKPTILTLIKIIDSLQSTPNEVLCDITNNDSPLNTLTQIFSELSSDDREFIINIVREYKRLVDKKKS